uniref:Lipocalin n=1 Tax=Rhipicephalus appendiculatus TaxID=34631 RepID=A0A131YTI6_RHIAP
MAGLLTISSISLALFALAQRHCTAEQNRDCTSAAHGGTSPEATGKENVNTYKELWKKHYSLMVLQANRDFLKCEWYVRNNSDENGVDLETKIYLPDKHTWKKLGNTATWKFSQNNSMTWREDEDIHRKTLLYNNSDFSCGVSKYEYFMDSDKEQCNGIYLGAEHCKNNGPCTQKGNDSFSCLDPIKYELLVAPDLKDKVPKECQEVYEKAISQGGDNNNTNVDECANPVSKK